MARANNGGMGTTTTTTTTRGSVRPNRAATATATMPATGPLPGQRELPMKPGPAPGAILPDERPVRRSGARTDAARTPKPPASSTGQGGLGKPAGKTPMPKGGKGKGKSKPC